MMKTYLSIIIISFLSLVPSVAWSTDYYVRPDGNNKNNGKGNTPTEAWSTLSYAFSKLVSGDRLLVSDGIYNSPKLRLQNLHAKKENPTIIQSINRWGAKITLSSKNGWDNQLEIANCQYLVFDGFEIYDANNNKGSGIDVRENSNHINIQNCYVHDCGCGGISSRVSDYLTIERNVTRDNAKRNEYNCSGISIWHPVQSDTLPGYHMIIRENVAFENECTLPFTPGGFTTPTDGNGIIVDDYYNTQGGGQVGGYNSETLIENNLSFNNGGRGIAVYKSDKVTVRNNTLWHNMFVLSQFGKYTGDLEFFESRHSNVYNNITVQHPNYESQAFRMYQASTDSKVYNNLVIGIKDFYPVQPIQKGNIIRNKSDQLYVKFLNPTTEVQFDSTDSFYQYFGLATGSPAINAATTESFSETDLRGIVRATIDSKPDIGCFEAGIVSAIDDMEAGGSFSIYPNPAGTYVNVRCEPNALLQFFDSQGRLLFEHETLNELSRIDLQGIKPGIYFIKFSAEKNQSVKKLVIN